ncbi:MAG: hypothetical protein ACJAS1_001653 [Oleiphilaceae bacterium]|jgi:hypothetical protein
MSTPAELQMITITSYGDQMALILNGILIKKIDPSKGDSEEDVTKLAEGLSKSLKVPVVGITHDPVDEHWGWSEVVSKYRNEIRAKADPEILKRYDVSLNFSCRTVVQVEARSLDDSVDKAKSLVLSADIDDLDVSIVGFIDWNYSQEV